jgi:putative nucleotidyltransferase with HDIG domain
MPVTSANTLYSLTRQRPQILCLDSDAPGLALLDAILSPRGYEVIRTGDSREALDILKGQNVDVVLLGAILPGMDGFAVCSLIRAEEQNRDVSVIMLSALKSRGDMIRGVEAGADDYLFKPLDHDILLARISMLVKRKSERDSISQVYENMSHLTTLSRRMADRFNPLRFDFQAGMDSMVGGLVRKTADVLEKPRTAMIGMLTDVNQWHWWHYEFAFQDLNKVRLDFNLLGGIILPPAEKSLLFSLIDDQATLEAKQIIGNFRTRNMSIDNGIGYLSHDLCVLAVNYINDVGLRHLHLMEHWVVHIRLFHFLSLQIREVKTGFDYVVHALVRAGEAHDDETGNHVYRVADYCGVIAERLGLKEDFVRTITVQALLHDIGKIYTPSHILKKTEPLTAEESVEMRKHTLWGAKIIGAHPRLHIAQSIALNHHERWDGSGYPRGLKGDAIPIEARIAMIADQYDTLRIARPGKPALDHATVTRIFNHGDNKIKPQHFDPDVLKAYRETAFLFEEIFERRRG